MARVAGRRCQSCDAWGTGPGWHHSCGTTCTLVAFSVGSTSTRPGPTRTYHHPRYERRRKEGATGCKPLRRRNCVTAKVNVKSCARVDPRPRMPAPRSGREEETGGGGRSGIHSCLRLCVNVHSPSSVVGKLVTNGKPQEAIRRGAASVWPGELGDGLSECEGIANSVDGKLPRYFHARTAMGEGGIDGIDGTDGRKDEGGGTEGGWTGGDDEGQRNEGGGWRDGVGDSGRRGDRAGGCADESPGAIVMPTPARAPHATAHTRHARSRHHHHHHAHSGVVPVLVIVACVCNPWADLLAQAGGRTWGGVLSGV
jgi:hypothetical protein